MNYSKLVPLVLADYIHADVCLIPSLFAEQVRWIRSLCSGTVALASTLASHMSTSSNVRGRIGQLCRSMESEAELRMYLVLL